MVYFCKEVQTSSALIYLYRRKNNLQFLKQMVEMEESRFKMFSFLLKHLLLLQLVYSIHHQYGAEGVPSELHNRMSKIEAQTRRHESEISILKTEKIKDMKEIHQLRQRIGLLEDSTFYNASSSEKMKRSKRPVRFLPSRILRPYKITAYNMNIDMFYYSYLIYTEKRK